MAKMRPELKEEDLRSLRSQGEAKVYRALRDELPDDVLVIHSLAWTYKTRQGELVEGEADFTLFFKNAGFLTIEVKGGGVAYNATSGMWSSIDRKGISHPIKDPFRQARKERFAVLDQIKGHADWRKWRGRRIQAGHAVFFPDLDNGALLIGPDRPADIIGTESDLAHLDKWIARAIHFWEGKEPFDPLGTLGLSLVETIFCRSIEVRPLLAQSLHVEEQIRIRLTQQQARVLRILGGRKRAVISGGAGTGKTLLAAEKARTLASEYQKVLFLCYNRPLADALKRSISQTSNVQVLTFHQLCESRAARVHREHRRDLLAEAASAYPGADRFDVQMPFALALSNEVLAQKFDAIVVDEAQDFSDEYWFAIEELLSDPKDGALYVFTDPNQVLYRRHANLPVKDEPFYLTINCRNTRYIHQAAYRYFRGEPTDPPDIEGTELIRITGRSIEDQAAHIAREVSRLITREGVRPAQVVILVLGRPKNQFYDALAKHSLGKATGWSIEVHDPERVLMDTVKRFKGLEAAIVFFWLPPVPSDIDDREVLYVGLSRAKSMIYIVGTENACAALS
jgi:hypothetical protein